MDVIGPDGTVYTSEGSVILPPALGAYGPAPVDVSRDTTPPVSGDSWDNAHAGPYRKVESYRNYWRINGNVTLPTSPNHIHIAPTAYPTGTMAMSGGRLVPAANSGDIPFFYLGSQGAGGEEISAGLRCEPSDNKWNMFIRVGPSRLFWVFDPNPPAGYDDGQYPTPVNNPHWLDFSSGSTVTLDYWCGKDHDAQQHPWRSGVWLRATGGAGERACFTEVSGHPQGGYQVSVKRVFSMGQLLPFNYDAGYTKSGSYFIGAQWSGLQIYDMTRSWPLDAVHSCYKQEFPAGDENVVTYFMNVPYTSEKDINIDLR